MENDQVPVLIVGGSLVGLTASVLLGSLGVEHLLVERHRGTAIHPRAASFHQRTMEIFRSAGIEAAVEAAAAREFVQNGALIAVDSLAGRELACFYRSFNDGVEELSPTRRLFITQIGLEPVLRARAVELGARQLYATELIGFDQDGDGVTARLKRRDDEKETIVRARYLIAADGTHSPVRRQLGIEMTGRGSFADCITIYFKADVREMIGGRNLSVVYVNRPDLLAFFRFSITGDAGFLAVFSSFDAEGNRARLEPRALSPESCAELVRTALGASEDFPVAIDDVQPWTATAATAAAFRRGRTFLAGDAAHQMPPTGGFGGNSGVADVHNLAWKIAMVLNRGAGPELLDTYESERRPISALTVEQAYARYVARVDPSLPNEDPAPMLDDAAIELGSIYRSGAVLDDGEPPAEAPLDDPRRASGRPGTRLPHVALERNGHQISSLDLAGRGFTLVAGPAGAPWKRAATELMPDYPLGACRVGEDALDPAGRLEAATGIGTEGALLLRPDGVVAWRTKGASADPRAILADALDRLTFR
jgi:2-polyprenyl-6-methoxyphenol hydroxylase-like FAD-dependent oxidoreductase